jgi:hypothetical protein
MIDVLIEADSDADADAKAKKVASAALCVKGVREVDSFGCHDGALPGEFVTEDGHWARV